jgi:hypothetical protein
VKKLRSFLFRYRFASGALALPANGVGSEKAFRAKTRARPD